MWFRCHMMMSYDESFLHASYNFENIDISFLLNLLNKKCEANQILIECGCSLLFTLMLVVGHTDRHIHDGGMELRNPGDGLQISVPHTASTRANDVVVFVVMGAIAKFDGGRLEGVSW